MPKEKAKRRSTKLLTKSEFAELENVTRPAVSKWLRAGMPVEQGGRINPAKARRWLNANTLRDSKGAGLLAVRIKKETARTRLLEFALREKLQAESSQRRDENKLLAKTVAQVCDWMTREIPDVMVNCARQKFDLSDGADRNLYAELQEAIRHTLTHRAEYQFQRENAFVPNMAKPSMIELHKLQDLIEKAVRQINSLCDQLAPSLAALGLDDAAIMQVRFFLSKRINSAVDGLVAVRSLAPRLVEPEETE